MKFYRDTLERQSHALAPLPKITSNKVKIKWTKIEQYLFETIKCVVAHDILLVYLDFNREFKIHNDAIKFQLGAVISYNGKPIALYSRKLTDPQKRYTVKKRTLKHH